MVVTRQMRVIYTKTRSLAEVLNAE